MSVLDVCTRCLYYVLLFFRFQMQVVVKQVVYSFRYRLGPGLVGREVFHIVLRRCETLWSAREIASMALSAEQVRHTENVFHIALRACEIPRSVSKTVSNFFHYGLHLRPKKSNTCSGDDVRRTCCYFLGCKCMQWWKKLFTVFDTDWVRGRWGGRCFT